MPMMPYTPDAVRIIRSAPKSGLGRAAILAQLGWDDAMLDRVCQRHGIDFRALATPPPTAAPETATVKTPLPALARRSHRRSPAPATVPRDMTSIMICVSATAKEALQSAAHAAWSAVGLLANTMLMQSLASGEAARCPEYQGPRRGCYVSIAMERSMRAALKQAMAAAGHPNMSIFGAAIIERHLVRAAV